jgi:hypothetical protein
VSKYARVTKKILKDIDWRAFDDLRHRINAGKHVVRVGVPSGETEADGTPLTLIAAVHEFGTGDGHVPERAFLRTAMQRNAKKYVALNRRNLLAILNKRMTVEQALGLLGEMAKGDVQTEIRHGQFKPLDPKTIAARRRARSNGYNQSLQRKVKAKEASGTAAGPIDRPLIDSGQLRQSITWAIE